MGYPRVRLSPFFPTWPPLVQDGPRGQEDADGMPRQSSCLAAIKNGEIQSNGIPRFQMDKEFISTTHNKTDRSRKESGYLSYNFNLNLDRGRIDPNKEF
jgi:hypothetical protein